MKPVDGQPQDAAAAREERPISDHANANGNGAAPSERERYRILIIEDEAVTAMDLKTELEGFGYDVVGIADDKVSAVWLASESNPDLVLTDIRLAHGDSGIEAAQEIIDMMDVAIVFLTAHSDQRTLNNAVALAPLAFLVKPFDARELNATIELAISRHRKDASVRKLARELSESQEQYAAVKDALAELAITDPLTGLRNRRGMEQILRNEWNRLGREHLPLALMMVDIDHFKAFNDQFGHLAGDECLKKVSGVLAQSCRRPGDAACRFGGEEFLLILPGVDRGGAQRLAAQLLEEVRSLVIPHPGNTAANVVTVSIGLAIDVPGRDEAYHTLLERADRGLYKAKAAGRNQWWEEGITSGV